MSDRRHRSTPSALPEGYQYGDARFTGRLVLETPDGYDPEFGVIRIYPPIWKIEPWRAPHENAAEQLKRQAEGFDVAGEVTREDRIQRTGDDTRIEDMPDHPIELLCRECGQPPDIFLRRTRVETDADGRAHVVSGAIVYCPSAFHFDPPQRTGEDPV